MSVNDEFDLAKDLDMEEMVAPPAMKKPAAKLAKKIEAQPDPVADEKVTEEPAPKKKNRVRIMIDEVAGMNNFEVVGVNGVIYQIKRGVPVEVPPEVVHVLENAQMTHVERKRNLLTGEVEETRKVFSAIPWRRV